MWHFLLLFTAIGVGKSGKQHIFPLMVIQENCKLLTLFSAHPSRGARNSSPCVLSYGRIMEFYVKQSTSWSRDWWSKSSEWLAFYCTFKKKTILTKDVDVLSFEIMPGRFSRWCPVRKIATVSNNVLNWTILTSSWWVVFMWLALFVPWMSIVSASCLMTHWKTTNIFIQMK